MHSCTAFSSKKSEGEEVRRVKNIFISGLPAMTEQDCAQLMVREARAVMTRDLGLPNGTWEDSKVKQMGINEIVSAKSPNYKRGLHNSTNQNVVEHKSVSIKSPTPNSKTDRHNSPTHPQIIKDSRSIY